jgi:hypothetical protein
MRDPGSALGDPFHLIERSPVSFRHPVDSPQAELLHPNQPLQLKAVEFDFTVLRTLQPGQTTGGEAGGADEHEVDDLGLARRER